MYPQFSVIALALIKASRREKLKIFPMVLVHIMLVSFVVLSFFWSLPGLRIPLFRPIFAYCVRNISLYASSLPPRVSHCVNFLSNWLVPPPNPGVVSNPTYRNLWTSSVLTSFSSDWLVQLYHGASCSFLSRHLISFVFTEGIPSSIGIEVKHRPIRYFSPKIQ